MPAARWRKIAGGLPTGDIGRIGLDIYRRNSNIVYAIVENRDGGVFRSEDKGETWTKVNSLNPRPMYFSQIRVDPNEPQRIYVNGVNLHISDDGGKTFRDDGSGKCTSDHHAFWINPRELAAPDRRQRRRRVGEPRSRADSWEHLNNYPIGQFYNVDVDMQQPYHIYGGMQDNASWGGPSSVRDRQGIANEHWYQMLSCDGMFTVVDPLDRNTVYTNCQNGRIVRYDRKTGERKSIMPQAEAGQPPLRWNWTAPIVVSSHDKRTLYTAAQRVFKSPDRGQTWSGHQPGSHQRPQSRRAADHGRARAATSPWPATTACRRSATSPRWRSRRGAPACSTRGTDDGNVQVSTRRRRVVEQRGEPHRRRAQADLREPHLTPSAFAEGTVYASLRRPPQRRLQAVGLRQHRLRRDVALDQRQPAGGIGLRDQGRSEEPEPALRRHRVRAVRLGRSRRATGRDGRGCRRSPSTTWWCIRATTI